MKKNILALVLAALCVMLLSACGAEKPAAQPTAAPCGNHAGERSPRGKRSPSVCQGDLSL